MIPLFGIMYIVLNVAFPSEVQGLEYNVIYLYIEMGYNSFQVRHFTEPVGNKQSSLVKVNKNSMMMTDPT